MSVSFVLDAELRTDMGKGASRRLRRNNRIPGVVYGAEKEPVSITLSHNAVQLSLENEAFYSHILTLKLDGKEEQVVLRDLQRHPAKPFLLHLDLQRVSANKALHVHVPLHFINEATCHGVKVEGGGLSKIVTEVEVSCLPKDLPEYLEVDIADLKLGSAIHLTELKLPKGIELVALSHGGDHDTAVVSVHKMREVSEESDTPEASSEDAADADADADAKSED